MGFSPPSTRQVTNTHPNWTIPVDPTSSGIVEFRAFERAMVAKLGEQDTKEEMLTAFNLFTNGNGRITLADLKRVARELGESLTDEELQEMIEEADRSGGGAAEGAPSVSFQDFAALMKKTNLF